jgi:hypothetical protein
MGVNRMFKGFRARQEAQKLAELSQPHASQPAEPPGTLKD